MATATRKKPPAAAPNLTVQAHSVSRALNLIGDRWTLLLLYCLFLGVNRYSELLAMTGMARSVLANRLQRLQKAGLLRRRRYQQNPPRDEYFLSECGADLHDVACAVIGWDRRWHYDAKSPMHRLRHAVCGREFTPQQHCAACGERVEARDVEWRSGPGAGLDPHPGPRAHRRSSIAAEDIDAAHPIMQRSFDILGDRWTAMTVAAAFYRHRRFGEFQQALGIASNILADRLARLVELEVLSREEDAREGYRLSEQGRDLFPIIVALIRWGDRWLAGAKGPPLLLVHRSCGQALRPRVGCDRCGGEVGAGEMLLSGARRRALGMR
ncbi:transcriptional regulator [Solimonas sp. K1W22B-7]|uniref:winged helix-turn-helix transcriptional regulator n=1 Tax=Solimonas sp. K1W22B-7 TaxID=2303331 RepID=UPI000E33216D|nr:helix-turn-helix domain-containing protein [Solimonas sp. K1W22B-7]AXQ27899.1 transcriptional regulator [Solimonas sp. K1W22B-7]